MQKPNRFVLPRRVLALCAALCLAAALALAPGLALPARADSGDLDQITRYELTVTPQEDGTLVMTAELNWLVLDSDSEGPLEWAQIGLPNSAAEQLAPLTDTIREIYTEGSYAVIYFDRLYYAGETVRFAFSWVQPYLYQLDEDGGVFYSYTPGWFDSANVDALSLTWNYGSYGTAGTVSAQGGALETGPGTAVLTAGPLGHGERVTLEITYTGWAAPLSEGMSADAYDGETLIDDPNEDAAMIAVIVVLVLCIMVVLLVAAAASSDEWDGGFGTPVPYVYVRGLYYPKGPDGRPVPGSKGVAAPPRVSMGGGKTHGGGAGRGGGGCACASSCACACACACAGGGRAGCSAKNLYGAIHLPAEAEPDAPARGGQR